jgi:hypothetical protein
MSDFQDDGVDETLVRPFLRAPRGPASVPSAGGGRTESSSDDPVDEVAVRAFMMTDGRRVVDAVAGVRLGFETIIMATEEPLPDDVRFERARIVELCRDGALSVAEVSAHLKLPITIVQVLAGELVKHGLLRSNVAKYDVTDDVSVIERLIRGVRGL